ncbi:hypothetical protein ABPG75_005426 [Micractinium tetrahymenae]
MPSPCRLLPLAALLLLLAGSAAAGRPLSPQPENLGPSAEPNVTAQDGLHPFLQRVGAAAAAAGEGVAASAGAAAAAAALPTPSWLPAGTFSGDGTAFSEAVPGTGAGFACSFRYLNPYFSTHFAAINKPMWDEGAACGRCITAWCVDDRCQVQGKRVTVMVTDLCPECKEGDVDFSIPVYREITGMWPHRLRVQWEWSDCSAMIDGDILLTPKDGINPQWQAFYFANTKYPLKSVRLNGMELQRSEFQFWVHPAPLSKPATFEFEAVNGAKVSATVDDPLRNQTLPVNFQ